MFNQELRQGCSRYQLAGSARRIGADGSIFVRWPRRAPGRRPWSRAAGCRIGAGGRLPPTACPQLPTRVASVLEETASRRRSGRRLRAGSAAARAARQYQNEKPLAFYGSGVFAFSRTVASWSAAMSFSSTASTMKPLTELLWRLIRSFVPFGSRSSTLS